jgi:hypothetical protein
MRLEQLCTNGLWRYIRFSELSCVEGWMDKWCINRSWEIVSNWAQEMKGTTLNFFKKIFLLSLYRGYIVTFTKVLTIYHSWIHLLQHFLSSLPPHFWNGLNRCHFSIFIHEYIIFLPYSPPPHFPYSLPPPTGTIPRQDLFCNLFCF